MDALGWDVHETDEKYLHWNGLTSYIEQQGKVKPKIEVSTLINKSGVDMNPEMKNTDILTIGSLVRMKLPDKQTSRQYRVELSPSNQVVLREMWKEAASGEWVASKNPTDLLISSISDCSVLLETAPDVEL